MDPGGVYPRRNVPASAPSTYHLEYNAPFCVWSNQTDALSVAQRTLMATYGCSEPYYFQAHNTNGGYFNPNVPCNDSSPWSCWSDKANGFLQLCYVAYGGPAYANTLGYMYYGSQLSDMPSHMADHTKWNYSSAMPSAPAGYEWVITWEDPHACSGGCMCGI
jgi:hypothetical protein